MLESLKAFISFKLFVLQRKQIVQKIMDTP